jgi:large subunit ribosomal protein L6
MSRVGKRPIAVPSGVSIDKIEGGVRVKGPKGTLEGQIPEAIGLEIRDGQIVLQRPDEKKDSRSLHGLARALVANMVSGVVEPFVKELEIQGVGYRADVSGSKLTLLLGFSHPVEIPVPDGLKVSVERNVILKIEGIDRQQVGQFAADLRAIRPPEPYKGKGIRYVGEHLRRKVGKAATGSSG